MAPPASVALYVSTSPGSTSAKVELGTVKLRLYLRARSDQRKAWPRSRLDYIRDGERETSDRSVARIRHLHTQVERSDLRVIRSAGERCCCRKKLSHAGSAPPSARLALNVSVSPHLRRQTYWGTTKLNSSSSGTVCCYGLATVGARSRRNPRAMSIGQGGAVRERENSTARIPVDRSSWSSRRRTDISSGPVRTTMSFLERERRRRDAWAKDQRIAVTR